MDKLLIINSIPESVNLVENYIEEVCAAYNVGPDVYGNILISLTEAVNNAIIHGNKREENKKVKVSHTLDNSIKSLIFTVDDEGDGFDYNNLPDPTSPENIGTLGGRGVFLIKQLADCVVFSQEGSSIELQFKV